MWTEISCSIWLSFRSHRTAPTEKQNLCTLILDVMDNRLDVIGCNLIQAYFNVNTTVIRATRPKWVDRRSATKALYWLLRYRRWRPVTCYFFSSTVPDIVRSIVRIYRGSTRNTVRMQTTEDDYRRLFTFYSRFT